MLLSPTEIHNVVSSCYPDCEEINGEKALKVLTGYLQYYENRKDILDYMWSLLA